MVRSLGLCLISLFVVTQGIGCGGSSDRPPIGEVSGTITLDGKPLVRALVEFAPEGGRVSYGTTDDNGYYELKYTNEVDGAMIGMHTVRIATSTAGDIGEGDDKKAPEEFVPPEFNTKTTQKAEVESGSNTFDFQIDAGGKTFPAISAGGA